MNQTPIKTLIEEVFKKTRKDSAENSKSAWCAHLEAKFRDELKYNEGVSSKTFERLYNKYILGSQPENAEPKSGMLNVMSQYLEYEDYKDFLLKNDSLLETDKFVDKKGKPTYVTRERIVILVLGIFILGMLLFGSITGSKEPKCMSWEGDHYEMASCEVNVINAKTELIVEYDKKLFKNMRLIPLKSVEVRESYYYKADKDSLEFYSWHGKHPINGAHLKPVTDYIYNKYVLPKIALGILY